MSGYCEDCGNTLCICEDDERLTTDEIAARNFDRIRHARGLTQQQLADAASIDRSAIGKIESGVRRITLAELVRFAQVLNVSPMALLDPDLSITITTTLDPPTHGEP